MKNLKTFKELNEGKKDEATHTKIWHKLDTKGELVYNVAKEKKMLPAGFDKNMWKQRGGLLLSHVADEIMKNPELAKDFGIDESVSYKETNTMISSLEKAGEMIDGLQEVTHAKKMLETDKDVYKKTTVIPNEIDKYERTDKLEDVFYHFIKSDKYMSPISGD